MEWKNRHIAEQTGQEIYSQIISQSLIIPNKGHLRANGLRVPHQLGWTRLGPDPSLMTFFEGESDQRMTRPLYMLISMDQHIEGHSWKADECSVGILS